MQFSSRESTWDGFFKHPVLWMLIGVVLVVLIVPVRATWHGLWILSIPIAIYAWLAKGEKNTGRFEVGDNCYFMGFVFTLTLITASLILDTDSFFDGGSENAQQLIATIGVALGTSVIGMFARFLLKHGIAEPADEFEQQVYKARRAADTLSATVEDLANAHQVAAERMREYGQDYGEAVEQAQARLLENLVNLTDATGASLQLAGEELSEQARSLVPSIESAVGSLVEGTAAGLDKAFRDASQNVSTTFQATADSFGRDAALLRAQLSAFAKELQEIQSSAVEMRKALQAQIDSIRQGSSNVDRTLEATVSQMLASAKRRDGALEALLGQVAKYGERLGDQLVDLSRSSEPLISDAARSLSGSVGKAGDLLQGSASEVSESLGGLLESIAAVRGSMNDLQTAIGGMQSDMQDQTEIFKGSIASAKSLIDASGEEIQRQSLVDEESLPTHRRSRRRSLWTFLGWRKKVDH